MYAVNLLTHLRAMAEATKQFGARAQLSFKTLCLEISHEGRYFELTPQFAENAPNNGLTYHRAPTPAAFMFTGWRLDPAPDIEIKRDKLAFKRFCNDRNLRTPALIDANSNFDGQVLVKERTLGGFRGLHYGPMRLSEARVGNFRSAGRNFIEEFVEGEPIQVWYWGGKLACVEVHKKAALVGNGISTVRELAAGQCPSFGEVDWQIVEGMARMQGTTLDTVLASERELPVDFRWQTPLKMTALTSENILEKIAGTRMADQLAKAGPIFLQGFPPPDRERALFRLDGVVDSDERVWFTSFDPDRYVHPDVYGVMVQALFTTPQRAAVLEKIQASLSETRH
jgi:hypothetical protein